VSENDDVGKLLANALDIDHFEFLVHFAATGPCDEDLIKAFRVF
jgi:hypothetical protein